MRGENTMHAIIFVVTRIIVWIAATITHFHKNSTKNAGWATFSASLQNSQTNIRLKLINLVLYVPSILISTFIVSS